MSRRGENIYKRKDGRWEGRYVKGRKSDGRVHYGYVYRKTYKETQSELLLQKHLHHQTHTLQGNYSGTCLQWVQAWLTTEVSQRVKLSTFASYHYKLQTYILPTLGSLSLNQLTGDTIQQLVHHWNESLSASTIQVLHRILHKCLQSAVNHHYLVINPCDNVQLPKKQSAAVQALTTTQQSKLEAAAENDANGLPTLLALHTGLRLGELSALRWENIDWDAQVLRVTHTYQRLPLAHSAGKTQLIYSQAKTASSIRVVPLSQKVAALLKQYRTRQTGQYVFEKRGKPMEPRLLSYHFKHILQQAQLSNIHFHQLRHTFATRCMEAKGDVAAISALLGHASAKTTLDVYTDALMEQRRVVILAMETSTAH